MNNAPTRPFGPTRPNLRYPDGFTREMLDKLKPSLMPEDGEEGTNKFCKVWPQNPCPCKPMCLVHERMKTRCDKIHATKSDHYRNDTEKRKMLRKRQKLKI